MAERIVRVNGVAGIAFGIQLLFLPIYEDHTFYAQISGVLLVAFGYLLWIAPRDDALLRAAAGLAAAANIGCASVIVGRFAVGHVHHSRATWAIIVAVLVGFAVVEARIAGRRLAILLPRD